MVIDKLRLLQNKPISFNDVLFLHQPTINEISEVLGENGDQEFYNGLWLMCSAAYDMPSVLYDMKRNFMKVSDWEFFRMMAPTVDPEILALTLKEADGSGFSFHEFKEYERDLDGVKDIVLYRPELKDEDGNVKPDFMLDEALYKEMIPVIREMIGFNHKGKKAGDRNTLKLLIELDKKDRAKAARKKSDDGSSIFNMIISLVNTEECKYNYETIFDLTIYQILKSFQQIQGKKAAMALLQGSCSGFVDTSKIPKEDMSWVYSDEKYKPKARKLVNDNTKTGSKPASKHSKK